MNWNPHAPAAAVLVEAARQRRDATRSQITNASRIERRDEGDTADDDPDRPGQLNAAVRRRWAELRNEERRLAELHRRFDAEYNDARALGPGFEGSALQQQLGAGRSHNFRMPVAKGATMVKRSAAYRTALGGTTKVHVHPKRPPKASRPESAAPRHAPRRYNPAAATHGGLAVPKKITSKR